MAARRSSQLIVIGVSIFVIGASLVFLGLRSGGEEAPSRPTARPARTAPAPRVITVQGAGKTAPAAIPVPKNMQAVAIPMPRVAGLAGYAKPGDLVNLYATVKTGPSPIRCDADGEDCRRSTSASAMTVPYAKLVLPGAKVIDVKGGEDPKGDIVYLLALNAEQAETAIFYAKFESLWATLVPEGQDAAKTVGTDHVRGL